MGIKCPKCGFKNPEGFLYCGRCGSKLLKEKRGERKRVSVMFVDVAGFTSLSEKRDTEEVVKILSTLFEEIEKIIKKYNGIVDKYIGDAVLSFFGVTGEYENHAERAIRAGLEIIDFLKSRKFPYKLGVHIGINSGEILLTGIGMDRTLDYTVMGDTVNLAQRLESMAGFNEILVSGRTKELADENFIFEKVGRKKVKGKKEKVEIFRVKGISEEKGLYDTPFIERKEIKEFIESEIEKGEDVKVFVLYGEPGVGKTRLVHEFIEKMREDFYVIKFKASPFSGIFNILSEKMKKDFEMERKPYEGRWLSFLKYVERKKRVIFFLDDMQWADSLSYDFLKFLIERIKIPSMFFISTRDKEICRRRLKGVRMNFIKVKPFSYEEFKEFLEKIGAKIPVHMEEELFEKTGGNPLFIEEFVKTEGKVISDKIDSVIIAEVESLEDKIKESLRFLSVLGPSFEKRFLKVLNIKPRNLEELVKRGYLIKENGRYFFKTPLLQEVIYNTLLKEKRKEIHRKIYKFLKEEFDLTSLFHAFKGELFDEIIKNGEKILNKIFEKGRMSDVKIAIDFIVESLKILKKEVPFSILYKRALSLIHLGLFEEALNLINSFDKNKFEYYELSGIYYKFRGEVEKCLEILKKGILKVKNKKNRLKLYLLKADVLLDSGKFKEGLETLEKIKRMEKHLDDKERIRFMNLYQTALENTGEYEKSLQVCMQLYKYQDRLSPHHIANLEFSIALNKFMLGDYKDLEKWFLSSIKRYEFLREYRTLCSVLNEYAYFLYSKGKYKEALEKLDFAMELSKKTENFSQMAKAGAYKGIVYMAIGDFDRAEKFLKDSLEKFKIEKIHKVIYSTVLHNYATLLIYKGKFKESIPYFKKLVDMARREKDKFGENLNLYSLSLAFFLSGEITKAMSYIKKPLYYAGKENIPVFKFRILSLIHKIKIIKKEKTDEMIEELYKIAKIASRKDLIVLCRWYKFWKGYLEGKVSLSQMKQNLENLKTRIKFHIYLIEKYSFSLLKSLS